MPELADLISNEQMTLFYQHKYGVCGDECPYCQDEDLPPLPDGTDEQSDFEVDFCVGD